MNEQTYVFDLRSDANLAPFGEPNEELRHNSLNDKDIPDQHTIESITNLRAELDEINALKTVRSDKRRCADYYLWNDGNADFENRIGKFVTACSDLSKISICTENDDIFGVVVEDAGFVGNYSTYGRDHTYGLVATIGVIDVQCNSNVKVGDYVMSNDYGVAKTVNTKYGYKVLALKNLNGVRCATISLGAPISQVPRMSNDISEIDRRVQSAEQNSATALNVANDTNNKINKIHNAIDNAIQQNGSSINDISDIVEVALNDATEAKQSVEQLKIDVERSTAETLEEVKDAVEGVEKLTTDLNPIMTFADDSGNFGPATMARYLKEDAATKQEVFTLEQSINQSLSSFKQSAEGFEMLVTSIDKLSVSERSQSYSLTKEQATDIIRDNDIYIPYISHTEQYDGADISFTRDYYYVWKTDHWEEHTYPVVLFTATVPNGTIGQFWFVDSNVTIEGYEAKTLYQFNDNKWNKITIASGNANNRKTSLIQQTAENIKASVSTAEGNIAKLDMRVGGAETSIGTLAKWSKGGQDNGYTVAAIDQSASQDGATLTLMVSNEDGEKEISGASIVLGAGDNSYFAVDADHINFTGNTFSIATKQIISGSTNLAKNDVIKHTISGCEGMSNTPCPWSMTKTAPYDGSYIDSVVFEVGEVYTLSYYFKKTDGTLVNIGGHLGDTTEQSFYLDGVLQQSYRTPDNIDDDTDEHYVTVTFMYNGTDHIYIQPNRGDSTSITYDLWNIKLEKGSSATSWCPAVEDTVSGSDVVTRINASQEGVTIQGSKIDILGNATFSSLTTTQDGQTVIDGGKIDATSLTLSADNINNGTYRKAINVADNFIVDTSGNVQLNGSITWGTSASPTQVVYCASLIEKPTDGTLWSSFPETSADGWHTTFTSGSDYYGSYTYDGGNTWGSPIQIVGKQGDLGYSLQVKYINSETVPTISSNDVSAWSDTIPTVESGKKTYMTQKMSNATDWSTPIQISAEDGDTPTVAIDDDGFWVINGEVSSVKAEGDTPTITVGENGNWFVDGVDTGNKAQGPQGVDGDMIEYVYYRSTTEQTSLSAPSYDESGNLPTGWTASPQGITETYKYEYVSVRTKTNEEWSVFSTPVIWSKWGEKGQDGDGVEYKYCLTNSTDIPNYPTPEDETYVWTDDPSGVSEGEQYEYVVQIKITTVDGEVVTTPSNVALWAKYGSDADVNDANVFDVLTNNGTMYGCFEGLEDENGNKKLYINAAYIRSGTVESDLVLAGNVVAQDIDATGGTIGGWNINDDGILSGKYINNGSVVTNKTISGIISATSNPVVDINDTEAHVEIHHKSLVDETTTSTVRFIAGCTPTFNESTDDSDAIIDIANNAPFVVLEDGSFYASNAEIDGTINASDGHIGNLKIQDGGLQGLTEGADGALTPNFTLNSDGLMIPDVGPKIQVGNICLTNTPYESVLLAQGKVVLQSGSLGQPDAYIKFGGVHSGNTGESKTAYITLHAEATGSGNSQSVKLYAQSTIALPVVQYITFYYSSALYGTAYPTNTAAIASVTLAIESRETQSEGYVVNGPSSVINRWLRFANNMNDIVGALNAGSGTNTDNIAELCMNTGGNTTSASIKCGSFTWSSSSNNFLVNGNIILDSDKSGNLGSANSPWSAIFAESINTDALATSLAYTDSGTVDSSDRKVKKDIELLPDSYSKVFDSLEPVRYKYANNTSDRYHTGFIAQDVLGAVTEAGLTSKDFAAYCEWEKENGETTCGLRYTELIALCVNEIQKLKQRVEELENKLKKEG